MEGESTTCRRLNFQDNEARKEDDFDVAGIGNENQIVDFINLNNEKDLKSIHSFITKELIPKISLEFETEEDAYQFYLAYVKQVGFGIRRNKSHNDKYGKLVDRIFCCSAEGKREKDKRDVYVKAACLETRFGCEAKMKVSSRQTGKFSVVQFVKEHNYYLSSPNKTHLYRCHRKIISSAEIQIQMASDVGIPPKASQDLMVRQVGGRENLGFIPEDYKNYLRSKRTRNMRKGDTGGVLEYFHKMQLDDPNFFYAIQVDEDDLITNIFWYDAKMRADYANFGDVFFDTTYRKNNEGRPIALFVGVNHHKQTIIFGAALLYDETSLTYEWLFDTFTRAMGEKKPTTILTDQDSAMAKALASKWPETHHHLCIWHIYQNAAIHLSGVFSQFKDFPKDFGLCVYDFEEEEDFILVWNKMLSKYALEDNDWLRRMFRIKEKWALVYGRQMFCTYMTTTQRSESMNSVVKRYVTYQHKFLEFFNHFQILLEDRRYEELKAVFRSNTSVPSLLYPVEILKHASSIYTPEAYKCFQHEWYKSHDSSVEIFENVGSLTKYKVTPHKKSYHHIVTLNSSSEKIECSCRKYEFAGILCSHILKIYMMKNIMKIPSEYILKRWTRKAKVGYFGVKDSNANTSNLDPKILQNMRYKELCGLYVQLVTKAAEREDTYKVVKDGLWNMFKMVDERLQVNELTVQHSNVNQEADQLQIGEGNSLGVKGIKIKKKTVSGKRLKGGLEKVSRKRKAMKKTSKSSTIVTVSSPLLPSNTKGIEENSETISSVPNVQCQRRINQVKPTNQMQTLGSCVDNLGMAETHFSQLLPAQLSQAVSTSSSPQNFVGRSQSLMSMTNILLAQQPLDLGYFKTNNLEECDNVNYEASAEDASCNDKCGCSFLCPGGMHCK